MPWVSQPNAEKCSKTDSEVVEKVLNGPFVSLQWYYFVWDHQI